MDQRIAYLHDFYGPKLSAGGPSERQLGWENHQAHIARFRVLARSVDLAGKSLLDVGCGLGDLSKYLAHVGARCSYLGVDILPEMVEAARRHCPGAAFECRDVIADPAGLGRRFDVVYSTGIFNLSATADMAFLREGFAAFRALAGEAVVVSLLRAGAPGAEDQYRYFDPAEVVAALAHPDWRLELAEGYLRNDFTVIARFEA